MFNTADDGQSAKVLVQGDQHALLAMRSLQDLNISGVLGPVPGP